MRLVAIDKFGEAIEKELKSETFPSKKEWEDSSARSSAVGVTAVAQDVWKETHNRWDYLLGPR
jgi:hypothetical protein